MESKNPPVHHGPWLVTAFQTKAREDAERELVQSIRELRARILFDHGRRPAFRDSAGAHVDDQDLDYGAWHFVARREPEGPPVGYVRLSTPQSGETFQSLSYLGAERYGEVLREHGFGPGEVFEHSRLVVEHHARKLGLGVYLNAMAIGAAQYLGAKAMIGTSGTADGQDRFHHRFGFRPVDGTRRYVEQYTEDVVVLLYQARDGAGQYTALVDELQGTFPSIITPPRQVRLSARRPHHAHPPAALAAHRAADEGVWQPVLYQPADDGGYSALAALLGSGQVAEVCDTIDTQLTELVTSRQPERRFAPDELRTALDEQLAGRATWEYGAWAWYPWARRLVHVLPREEFRLVRTDRNRGRIDRREQRDLFTRRIGIIGLSVGSSAALTFAMEGIGGAYRLADFDELSLSNLNRLRAGAHELGLNKSVIAARQMLEIDPYLDIEIFPAGLTDETMEDFFRGGSGSDRSGAIDLLVEECDAPYVKFAARERARALGIPVVMDANDRGLLDVERFDLEPERPLLHGLLGETTSEDLRHLTFAQKVDAILTMVDRDRISPELAAAIPQIGATLSSWPQLASGVALGGALTAHAARRILLGSECPSGRYYTDFDTLISAERSTVA
ncbi:ThiF family adenylyltransferase [Streptomyces sp. NPDC050738]|uniref:ThiF family adenylyltransferase n=1 Tax=Streptomyces sp. NPDC050738 TaxID=3154744 RepID=UPI0034145F6A